jgi:hypothetical protein
MFKGDLGSDRTFEIAKQWLDDCIHNHDVCLASQTNALPARLLDLQTESGTPRLINCGGMEAKTTSYACLSYCWGQEPQPLLLTIENLSTLKMQIPLDSLPKTLKDAITTTIRLGLRYLWVDALCIVQDWDEDKATEISRMGQIYTNAHVTIAAASEASCDAGFLSERRAWWTERDGPPIKLPYLCPDNSIGTVYLVRGGEASIQEPLHLRAWTLQEHLLSRRILFYGKQQLYWICCSERLLKDSGSVYDHAIARFAPLRSLLLTERPSEEQNNVGNGDSHVRAAWKNLVEQYSGRAQSVSVDRLHALLGVLPRFQAHMRQQYVAGYWPPWLYDDLLWRRVGDALDRPSRRYPSWSWLSIDSAVKLDVVDNLSKKTRLAEVTGCDVEPIDPGNPYGELSSGILTIRGHCIAIRPNWEDLTLFFDDPDPHSTRFLHPSVNKMTFDTSDYLKEPDCNHTSLFGTGVIWCLSMMKAEVSNKVTDEWVGHAIWGLLLADVGDGNMKRVGCFTSCTGREERLLVGEQVSVRLI